jgi:flagellar basal-body rod protein FlgF
MGDLIDSAAAILSQSARRVEISAQNIANIATPGYKRMVSFQALLTADGAQSVNNTVSDFSAGKPVNTGNPLDLALQSGGFFAVRGESGLLYTRQGQFHRDAEGRLLTPQGYILQAEGGGDLSLKSDAFQVRSDGTVVEDGQPTSKIAIVAIAQDPSATAASGTMFSASAGQVSELGDPSVRQGVLESSNVTLGEEMTPVMQALRQAEVGQRFVNLYDDLMGRVVGLFGQASQS